MVHERSASDQELIGQVLRATVSGPRGGVIAEAGQEVTPAIAKRLEESEEEMIGVVPYVTDEINYLSADVEERYIIAQANAILDKDNRFVEARIEARQGERFHVELPEHIHYIDVTPEQVLSVATCLNPLLEHADAPPALLAATT